jgi:tripartite-type tricarboxylate transporter receptor subunit TctC
VQWYGFFVPKNTPSAIVSTLQAGIQKAADDARVKVLLANEGADLALLGNEALVTFLRNDIAKWQKIIRDTKLELQ